MTIIHECDRCNAPGSEASCPECGRLGVTATGICYACENTAPVRRGITRACLVSQRST